MGKTLHNWHAIFSYATENNLSAKETAEQFGISVAAVHIASSTQKVKLADGRALRRRPGWRGPETPDAANLRITRQQSKAAKEKWARAADKREPDLPGEEWRPCPSWPGYEASSEGRVRSRYKVLSRGNTANGYPTVNPSINGKQKPIGVHRMVVDAFIGPQPKGMDVRHVDGNRLNSRPDNLAYGTRSENQQDRLQHGTSNHGERNAKCKLTSAAALSIYQRAHAGENPKALANEFGVDASQVSAIKTGRSWSQVTGAAKVVVPRGGYKKTLKP